MFRLCFSMALLVLSLYAVFAAWAEASKALILEQRSANAAAPDYGVWLLVVIAVSLALSLWSSMVSMPAMFSDWYENNRGFLMEISLGVFLLVVFYWL